MLIIQEKKKKKKFSGGRLKRHKDAKGLIGIALILPCVEVLPNMTALLRIEVAVLNHLVVPMWLLVNDDQSQYA